MRLVCFLILPLTLLAQQPDVDAIMAKVAANQDSAQARRAAFIYSQKVWVRSFKTNGKLGCQQKTEYLVTPTEKATGKTIVSVDTECGNSGKSHINCEAELPPDKGKETVSGIDGCLVQELRNDLVSDKDSKDGLDQELFPLTAKELPKYTFHLDGEDTVRGHAVYRISFVPKKGGDDPSSWQGEALIDKAEYEPVVVTTKLAEKIPLAVRVLLGTNIHGLGFNVVYDKFDDGLWFPVSYGAEFRVRVIFFWARNLSVSLSNSDFRKASVTSAIQFAPVR
ncbi:MAG TPA: hypothetical protein VN610_09710 [Bryobacteraceae bacterium]|nr:hypothetical protein [Bryobacteraceae bacterium]